MIYFHDLNPVALNIGPLSIYWYGIMYLIGFVLGYIYLLRSDFVKKRNFSKDDIENVFFYALLAVIVGGRLGHFVFYAPRQLIESPLEIFKVWNGGMSIHGGIIAMAIAFTVLSWKHKKHFLDISDIVVVPATLGLAFGRIGNFINGELWGKPTDQSWGVVFSHADDKLRHPSQIYSSIKQLLISCMLYLLSKRDPKRGTLSFAFLLLYGIGRYLVEALWRAPTDGYILGISAGQFYSLPLVLIGFIGLIVIHRKK